MNNWASYIIFVTYNIWFYQITVKKIKNKLAPSIKRLSKNFYLIEPGCILNRDVKLDKIGFKATFLSMPLSTFERFILSGLRTTQRQLMWYSERTHNFRPLLSPWQHKVYKRKKGSHIFRFRIFSFFLILSYWGKNKSNV